MVADTAAEEKAAEGCPVNRNTCPGGGGDPIRGSLLFFHVMHSAYPYQDNFMDYSYDSCMTGFTKGQADRIVAQMRSYRAGSS